MSGTLLRDDGLFYVCSLIEAIGRERKLSRREVARRLGAERIGRVYELADVWHCLPLEQAVDELVEEAGLPQGDFDNVAACKYALPGSWDLGKVYRRLAAGIAEVEGLAVPEAVVRAFTSPVSDLIENYNCSFYYEAPQNILTEHLIQTGALDR